jgi:agmatine deiminase
MIPDWETNCCYLSRLLADRHPALCRQLTGVLDTHGIPVRFLEGTRDIWARDYCPIQVAANRFVKFRYFPDYLRGEHEGLVTDADTICQQLDGLGCCQRSDINLDGGNVVATRTTAIVTDKVYRENAGWQRGQLRRDFREALELADCVLIPKEPYDPIGHADGVVRFLDEGLAVVNSYSKVAPAYGTRLRKALQQAGLTVAELPYSQERAAYDGIPSAVGNYVNFLRIGQLIIVPAYGVADDDGACRTLEQLCPDAQVVSLPCTELAREGGVLNCITWTIKA